MNTVKRFFSRRFLFANLIIAGFAVGFVISAALFIATGRTIDATTVQAQKPKDLPAGVEASFDAARLVQGAFRYVAETVTPAVVEVRVVEEKSATGPEDNPWPWFFFNNPDDSGSAPKAPRKEKGLGSGVIVEQKGNTYYVITNNHVAGSANEITVVLHDKREFKGSLVGKDARRDIAVISFEAKGPGLPMARLGDSDSLRVGDWAIAVGNPLGLSFSVTTGTVSALARNGGPGDNISDFIQTDASINQGNSGGALVNIDGEVVGINTWIASPTGGSIGLGFAIPINNIKRAMRDLIDKKPITYGWLGVRLQEVDSDFLKSLGLEGKQGAFVEQVVQGSPADKAGIIPGDLVTAMDKRAVGNSSELTRYVGDIAVGTKTEFTVIRSGTERKLTAKIDARDEKTVTDNSRLWPGFVVVPPEAVDSEKKPEGLVVVSVIPTSPAAGMGLQARDEILSVNGKKIKNLKDFYESLAQAGQKIMFGYKRNGQDFETPSYMFKK
jgi:Do/DeqQ family serine protease